MTVLLWTVLALGYPVEEVPPAPGPPVVLALEDQFGKRQSVADHRGDVLVLVYGDGQAEKLNNAVRQRLHNMFHPAATVLPPDQAWNAPVRPVFGAPGRSPDVRVVAVAYIGKAPPGVRVLLRRQFTAASPHVPVWLDFEDAVKQAFEVNPRTCNVVVFDAAGRFRMRASGELDEAAFSRLAQKIESLRVEAVTNGAVNQPPLPPEPPPLVPPLPPLPPPPFPPPPFGLERPKASTSE
jgi:hypothetical protein